MSKPTYYLGLSALAARAGITKNTASSYRRNGYLPTPDVLITEGEKNISGWSEETIDEWLANRPGRGARTDLHGKREA
ncbi:helix-turn-helix transcriptional regulator [Schaalia sp. lx-260]|uniref:helix-turn-helix transcriptional regulator n=1 Tax=Schaalia sp. lx-260 TaxID=2899082 RepID=UPI001E57534E|nr:transcriptional regulator [Schaalia sp. lx-260]MCD4549665.1 transcriptional regulator [Schaalia sp. lx-260]